MSNYTTEVRYICEDYAGLNESADASKVDEVIKVAMSKVFDFDYPIFDEGYRSVLQAKILKHYYTREIGAETVGLWKLWLNTRMNEIMPYYNKLYESEKLNFNPLFDVDITRTHVGRGNNSGVVSSNGESWDKYSETPQGTLNGLESDSYLTTATKRTGDNSSTSNINTTDEYVERITGKQGTTAYSKMIKEYRDILMNIDMRIINELKDLFMNMW